MVDITEALESDYLTADLVNNLKERVGTIVSDGKYEDVEYNNIKSRRLTLQVDVNGRQKIWRPNRDSIKNLSGAFGRDTKLWMGKKIAFNVVSMMGKDSVIAIPAPDIAVTRHPEPKLDYTGVKGTEYYDKNTNEDK